MVLRMLHAVRSDIGLVRSMNQDGYIIVPALPVGHLYLVADGMGGPAAGDVASQLAVEQVSSYLRANVTAADDVQNALMSAIQHANETIYRESRDNPEYDGMGTTIVCALVRDETVYFAHVGDSRGYLYSDGALRQITKDHSLVAELVRRGELTADEAKTHPQRNIVTRSLGTGKVSTPDVNAETWHVGDVILLCSDGLTNLVLDSEITSFMDVASRCEDEEKLQTVIDNVVDLALKRGGSDNVTALIAVFQEERDAV